MKVEIFNKEDYSTVSSWWEKQSWPVIPESSLSTTGFIIKDNKDSYLAGWVYHTNSDIAWLEFIVANPEIKDERREKAFDMFFSTVCEYIKVNNFKNVFMSITHPKLMKRIESYGFKKSDENMTNFIRSL